MHWWLVTVDGNLNWLRHLRGQRGLSAPSSGRLGHAPLARVRAGDMVLLYTTYGTGPRHQYASVAAVAQVAEDAQLTHGGLAADLAETMELPQPVHIRKMKETEGLSPPLRRLLRMNMQAYITPLTNTDAEAILGPSNWTWLSKVRRMQRQV